MTCKACGGSGKVRIHAALIQGEPMDFGTLAECVVCKEERDLLALIEKDSVGREEFDQMLGGICRRRYGPKVSGFAGNKTRDAQVAHDLIIAIMAGAGVHLWTVRSDYTADREPDRCWAKAEITIPSSEFPSMCFGRNAIPRALCCSALRFMLLYPRP